MVYPFGSGFQQSLLTVKTSRELQQMPQSLTQQQLYVTKLIFLLHIIITYNIMGAAGAIKSLQQNRALLKERHFKKIGAIYLNKYEKEKIEFKKVSPEELVLIKEKIRQQFKRKRIQELLLSICALGLSLGLLYLAYLKIWL